VNFNNPAISGGGMQYTSPQNYITITTPGTYRYEYRFSTGSVTTVVALFLNNVQIPSSTFESIATATNNGIYGNGIFTINCSNVPALIQLENIQNTATFTTTNPGLVNISLVIYRIN